MRGAARKAAKTCEHYRGEIVVIHKQKIPSMTWGDIDGILSCFLFFLDKSYHSDYYAGTKNAADDTTDKIGCTESD